jgi:hypothetical protein
MSMTPGKITKAWYILCAAYNDTTDCVEEIAVPAVSYHVMPDRLRRYGWMRTIDRGWLCPACAAKQRAAETRAKTRAETLRKLKREASRKITPQRLKEIDAAIKKLEARSS